MYGEILGEKGVDGEGPQVLGVAQDWTEGLGGCGDSRRAGKTGPSLPPCLTAWVEACIALISSEEPPAAFPFADDAMLCVGLGLASGFPLGGHVRAHGDPPASLPFPV